MERREQFLDIVKPFSLNSEIALKYALHLEELFDKILTFILWKRIRIARRNRSCLELTGA